MFHWHVAVECTILFNSRSSVFRMTELHVQNLFILQNILDTFLERTNYIIVHTEASTEEAKLRLHWKYPMLLTSWSLSKQD